MVTYKTLGTKINFSEQCFQNSVKNPYLVYTCIFFFSTQSLSINLYVDFLYTNYFKSFENSRNQLHECVCSAW